MIVADCNVAPNSSVRFWNSSAGLQAFVELLQSEYYRIDSVPLSTTPPHVAKTPELLAALREAVPPSLVAPSDADVDARVDDAARALAARIHGRRSMQARFHDHCHGPFRPKHATYTGSSDRRSEEEEPEMRLTLGSNPFFSELRDLLKRTA